MKLAAPVAVPTVSRAMPPPPSPNVALVLAVELPEIVLLRMETGELFEFSEPCRGSRPVGFDGLLPPHTGLRVGRRPCRAELQDQSGRRHQHQRTLRSHRIGLLPNSD